MKSKKRFKSILIIISSIIVAFTLLVGISCLLWSGLDYEFEHRLKSDEKVYSKYEKLDKNHLYIVTKDDYNGDINYYKISKKLKLDKVNKFKYKKNKTLHLSNCFKSYIDRNRNVVLNKLDTKNCKVKDNEWNEIRSNKNIDNIIKLVSKLKHDIILSDVIILNDTYYVIIGLNVNMWTPYYLYKYDDNKLKEIHCFTDEKIISLNEI